MQTKVVILAGQGLVFSVWQNCMRRSTSGLAVHASQLWSASSAGSCKLPETSNSVMFAKRAGIHRLQIIMIFLVEFGWHFYAAKVSIIFSFNVLTVLSLKSSRKISLFEWDLVFLFRLLFSKYTIASQIMLESRFARICAVLRHSAMRIFVNELCSDTGDRCACKWRESLR